MKQRTVNRKEREKESAEQREIAREDQANPENWGPANPYTAFKVRDHLFYRWHLKDEKIFTTDHLWAAGQIARGFDLITADVRVRVSNPAGVPGGGWHNAQSWSEGMVDCVDRYNDWVDEMGRYKLPHGLVRDMAIGWLGMMDARRKWRMGPAKIKTICIDGLTLYLNVGKKN